MKIEFDVWKNGRGEIHLTSEDKRLAKPINIRANDGLVSTSVLEAALQDKRNDSASTMIRLATAERGLEHERALRHDAEADRSGLLATIARLRGELLDLRTDGCGMTKCGMTGETANIEAGVRDAAEGRIKRMDWVTGENGAPVDDPDQYRMLADHVIELFNPHDGDEAEVSLCMNSLSVAAKVLRALPCTCNTEPGAWDQLGEQACCDRCLALGRFQDVVLQR